MQTRIAEGWQERIEGKEKKNIAIKRTKLREGNIKKSKEEVIENILGQTVKVEKVWLIRKGRIREVGRIVVVPIRD